MSVINLPGTTAHFNEEVVEILEEWLTRAKEGELKGIALVGLPADSDNTCTTQFHMGGDPLALVGGLEVIKFNLVYGRLTGPHHE